jgi:hypothetical protein
MVISAGLKILYSTGPWWAHSYNPSYSEGRDQDFGSKPAQRIVGETLSQKTHHKKGLVEWLKL